VAVGAGVHDLFLLCGHRSCGMVEGLTGGTMTRVCGDAMGGAFGRRVIGRCKGITGGSGINGGFGSWNVRGRIIAGLAMVLGSMV
jgi:hypothetical protein